MTDRLYTSLEYLLIAGMFGMSLTLLVGGMSVYGYGLYMSLCM